MQLQLMEELVGLLKAVQEDRKETRILETLCNTLEGLVKQWIQRPPPLAMYQSSISRYNFSSLQPWLQHSSTVNICCLQALPIPCPIRLGWPISPPICEPPSSKNCQESNEYPPPTDMPLYSHFRWWYVISWPMSSNSSIWCHSHETSHTSCVKGTSIIERIFPRHSLQCHKVT